MNFSLPPRVLSFPDIFHSLACRPLVLSLYFLVIRQPEKNISHCRFLSFSILSAFGFQGFLCSAFLSHLGSESETIFTYPAVSPFPFYFLSFLFLIFCLDSPFLERNDAFRKLDSVWCDALVHRSEPPRIKNQGLVLKENQNFGLTLSHIRKTVTQTFCGLP